MEGQSITIGERLITVEDFSTEKMAAVTELIAEAIDEYPEITKEILRFQKEYRKESAERVDRATAEYLAPNSVATISEEGWKASQGQVVLTADASTNEIVAAMFPRVVKRAKKQLIRFAGLIATPNQDLGVLIDKGDKHAEEVLDREGKKLWRQSKPKEFLDLVVLGIEISSEALEGQYERLGKALGDLGEKTGLISKDDSSQDESDESSSEPESSTDSSEPDIPGPEETSSTESLGERSEPISVS